MDVEEVVTSSGGLDRWKGSRKRYLSWEKAEDGPVMIGLTGAYTTKASTAKPTNRKRRVCTASWGNTDSDSRDTSADESSSSTALPADMDIQTKPHDAAETTSNPTSRESRYFPAVWCG